MEDDLKTWQWLIGMTLTVLLAIGGSMWSVAQMRSHDMERIRANEVEIANLKLSVIRMETGIMRIEDKLDDLTDGHRMQLRRK